MSFTAAVGKATSSTCAATSEDNRLFTQIPPTCSTSALSCQPLLPAPRPAHIRGPGASRTRSPCAGYEREPPVAPHPHPGSAAQLLAALTAGGWRGGDKDFYIIDGTPCPARASFQSI